jgi:hypothetical protein
MKSIISFLILTILICSCKKDEDKINYAFKGKVVDFYTGNGIPNATIYIKDIKIDPSKDQLRQLENFDTTIILDRVITHSNGNFDKTVSVGKGLYKIIVYDNKVISTAVYEISTDSIGYISIKVKAFKRLKVLLTTSHSDSIVLFFNSNDQIKNRYVINYKDTIFNFDKAIPESECKIDYRFSQDVLSKDTSTMISKLDIDSIKIKL